MRDSIIKSNGTMAGACRVFSAPVVISIQKRTGVIKKNEYTCRWRIEFWLAYDGGGCCEWTQYYFTKIGALFSKFWHMNIASWGGRATLMEVE